MVEEDMEDEVEEEEWVKLVLEKEGGEREGGSKEG